MAGGKAGKTHSVQDKRTACGKRTKTCCNASKGSLHVLVNERYMLNVHISLNELK